MSRIVTRNRLAFPAGRKPGFDPSHVALSRLKSNVVCSAIATRGHDAGISLINGELPTGFAGTQTSDMVDSHLGVCQQSVAFNLDGRMFFQVSNPGVTGQITLAAMFRPVSFAQQGSWLCAYDGESAQPNVPDILVDTTGELLFHIFAGGPLTIHSGINLTVGHPHFAGFSAFQNPSDTGGQVNFVIADLQTGQIQTSTQSIGTVNHTELAYGVDPHGGLFWGPPWSPGRGQGNWGAGMIALNFLSTDELVQWASDPWSFWYPDNA